jgi:hypothetical protein
MGRRGRERGRRRGRRRGKEEGEEGEKKGEEGRRGGGGERALQHNLVDVLNLFLPEVYSVIPSSPELLGDPVPSLPPLLLSLDEGEEELSPAELMGLRGGIMLLVSDT